MSDLARVWDTPKAVCPVGSIGRNYAPFDHERMHESLAVARRSEPVFYSPDIDYWVVTRYDDVFAILRDPDRFSAANANTPISPVPQEALDLLKEGGYALEGIQVNCDPPRHTRIRNSAFQLLNMKQFGYLEDDIRRLVIDSLDRMKGKSRVNLMEEFTYELPAKVIFLILGIPEDEAAQVKKWATNRLLLSFSRPTHQEQMDAARNLLKFWHYCVGLVARRIDSPQNDFASNMLRLRNGDDTVLTVNEINSVAFGLLFAGHETTTTQATNTINALLTERDSWEAICADPSLIPNAVEEGLRMYGAVVNWRRRTRCDVEISGVRIPAGSNILMSFMSANRDEKYFDRPDHFDLRRANGRKHLTFGNGIHVCLGAPLARLEVRIMLEELSKRYPDARLVGDRKVEYVPAFAFRVPKSLWVDLEA
ncbi:cytochrome P450 [Bradyrhizobium sp. LTSPM299]|jgi:cytochrome P450|uniref:cytochrome P450 n=1 Tax=Bradyrhizobium sp. LTSPM299 TaxID=1619233 RepID=UPI0009E3CAFD|nr:cytochrome P450 [Bradyrhizobium sp. LTSPM299]